jgi:hypothetical protein
MPSPRLSKRKLGRFLSVFETDGFAASAVVTSAHHAQALLAEVIPLYEPANEDGLCLRGLACAIGLETAAALCVYGVWQAWQILR